MPVIIDFLVLFIFLTFIFSFTPIGKAIADSIIRKNSQDYLPQDKYKELEAKIYELEDEISKLREIIIFNEEKFSQRINSETEIKKQNKYKNQIDLDKG